jgi:hypothetical protein
MIGRFFRRQSGYFAADGMTVASMAERHTEFSGASKLS